MAPIASGSFLTRGMVICPCSGGTLAAVSHAAGNEPDSPRRRGAFEGAAPVNSRSARNAALASADRQYAASHGSGRCRLARQSWLLSRRAERARFGGLCRRADLRSIGNCPGVNSALGESKLMSTRVRHFLEMIRFSHTLFALPFALLAAAMAWSENCARVAAGSLALDGARRNPALHGVRPQRRDGVQSACRRSHRWVESCAPAADICRRAF